MPKTYITSPPVSSAAVIAALGYTPENVANKATSFGTVNDTKYPSVEAVVEYVDSRFQSAVLEADFPKTNDTLAVVTGFDKDITLIAGHWYKVAFNFITGGGVGGSNWDWNGGTATITGMDGQAVFIGYEGDPPGPTNRLTALTTSFSAGVIVSGAMAGEVVIQCLAGGTLKPRFAQDTTDAAATTLLKYSIITAQDVTPA